MQTIILYVGTINCVVLCIIDTYNKAKLKQTTEINKYDGYLNKWSLLTMIICTITSLLIPLNSIPTLCKYFDLKYFPPPILQIFFTFYQIGRFHHCFKSFHSKYIFILLYINGVLLCVVTYFLAIISTHQELNHKNQCIIIINKHFQPILHASVFVWFLIWDIIVLVMYGVKLNTIKKSITNNPKQYRKVAQFLSKMLTLTIGLEVILCIFNSIMFFSMQKSDTQFYLQLLMVIYMSVTCVTIFLMAEHNSKIYQSFIKFLSKIIFCCGCCIRTVTKPAQIELHQPDIEMNTNANANHKNSTTKIAMTELPDACNKHEMNDAISHSKTEGDYEIDSILLKPKQYELLQIYKASQSQFVSDCIQLGLSDPDIEIITSHFENMKRIPTIDIKPQSQIEGL